MQKIALAAACGLIWVGGAAAADLAIYAEPSPSQPVSSSLALAGFYVGLNIGNAFEGFEYTDNDFDPPETYDFAKDPLLYGFAVGYDAPVSGRWLLGAELRYDQLDAAFAPFSDAGLPTLFKMHSSTSVVAKVGYLTAPGTQVYGVLGYGSVAVEAEEGFDGWATGNVGGIVAGIGAETRLTDLLSASVDARYFRGGSTFVTEDDEEFLPKYLMVTAGLKVRTGQPAADTELASSQPHDFTGFSLGASLDGAVGSMVRTVSTPGAETGPFWSENVGAGVRAGFDGAFGDIFLAGVGATADFYHLPFYDPAQDSPDVAGTTLFGTVESVFALTGKLGVQVDPSAVLYAKAGFAAIYTTANEDFFALDGGGTKVLPGYQVGIGLETALVDNWTLSVEGLYTEALEGLTTENTQLNQVALFPHLLTGNVGVNYRF